MKQLILDLLTPSPPSLTSFVVGANRVLVAQLEGLFSDEHAQFVHLWGAAGSGKTHLLEALTRCAHANGLSALYLDVREPIDFENLYGIEFLALDALEALYEEADQIALFGLYNKMKEEGGRLVTASTPPPTALNLKRDLKTRLSWGLVYGIQPLTDEEKIEALQRHAQARHFEMSEAACQYLLMHCTRDLPTLVQTLDAIDRFSLETKQPITVALLKRLLRG